MSNTTTASTQTTAVISGSENELRDKWEQCVSNFVVNSAVGLGTGAFLSLILFKRRQWPLVLGTGIGMGAAVNQCRQDFSLNDN
eukprot:Clim_evm6s223 gene=Clim_evmTU6s223